jgi:hypothetical protein
VPAVSKLVLRGKTALDQQLHRTVNRREANGPMASHRQVVQLIQRVMTRTGEEDFSDDTTLPGKLKTRLSQITAESIHRICLRSVAL